LPQQEAAQGFAFGFGKDDVFAAFGDLEDETHRREGEEALQSAGTGFKAAALFRGERQRSSHGRMRGDLRQGLDASGAVELHGPGAQRGGVADLEMACSAPAGEEPVAAAWFRFEAAEVAQSERPGGKGAGKDEKEGDVDEVEVVHIGLEKEAEEEDDDKEAETRCPLADAFTHPPKRAKRAHGGGGRGL
jgi:hypothetical protein